MKPPWLNSTPSQTQKSLQNLKEALAHAISNHCHSSQALHCLHSQAISIGLHSNLYISTLLITKYFHFGSAESAHKVFDSIPLRPTKPLLWNSLINGYLISGSPRLAIDVYQQMAKPHSGCEPDKQTFRLAITACTHLSEFELGSQIGDLARRNGLESDLLIATALVSMYAKANDSETARVMFDGMSTRDAVAYNAMMSGYLRAGYFREAMDLFKDMRTVERILPSEASFVIVISGLGHSGSLYNGQAVHALVIKVGFKAKQNVLNTLIAMYVGCDRLEVAAKLFDSMALKDAVSWSTMIGGYVEHEKPCDALELFHRMVSSTRILLTRPILLNALLACADLGDWRAGKWIEESFLKNESGVLTADEHLITALIYMYAKSGKMEVSLEILENVELVRGDVISWNAMMKACKERKLEDQVLELSHKMRRNNINPDDATFLLLLSVISSIPLPRKAMETHSQVIKRGFESERTIANSLIDVYSKCGYIDSSRKIFVFIQEKDVISWSCMIKGFAWNGNANEAIDHFHLMRKAGLRSNSFTFLAVLSACSHAGFVKEGTELFKSMRREYGMEPGIEHFTCMLDISCRAGLLKDAYLLLQSGIRMASSSVVLWGTLLNACRLHGDTLIGEAVAKHLFFLEPTNAANYLILANIYISEGRREDANRILGLLRTKGLENEAGSSWFEAVF